MRESPRLASHHRSDQPRHWHDAVLSCPPKGCRTLGQSLRKNATERASSVSALTASTGASKKSGAAPHQSSRCTASTRSRRGVSPPDLVTSSPPLQRPMTVLNYTLAHWLLMTGQERPYSMRHNMTAPGTLWNAAANRLAPNLSGAASGQVVLCPSQRRLSRSAWHADNRPGLAVSES